MTQDSSSDAHTDTQKCKKDPAPQTPNPKPNCADLPAGPPAPKPPTRDPCPTCCDCPPGPGTDSNCLNDLIKDEAEAIAKGEQAKKFKTELEGILAKVKTAKAEYTADSYKDLLERWKKEDAAILDALRNLTCALPCWWCLIECEVCPLVNAIRDSEWKLNGHRTHYPTVDNLYDLRHWLTREKARRGELFDHIAKIMAVWEKPFTTIDGILKANAEILKGANGVAGAEAPKLLFDVMFRVIPLHLAIAPPADVAATRIEKKYADPFCCDESPTLHDCCGFVIRLPTVRDRLIGPQPFLIAPEGLAEFICCLATHVYRPAKDSLGAASAALSQVETDIAAAEAGVTALLKALPADAKARLTKTIDCAHYKPKDGADKCCGDEGGTTQAAR